MSDDVKDFAYYAAKAELALRSSKSTSLEGAKLDIGRAEVYARLACGAPKPVPVPDWPMRDSD